MYADHNYYKDTFKGKLIPANDFESFSTKASSKIRYYTLNRVNINKIPDEVKKATCQVAEIYYKQNQYENIELVSSETLGPHTKHYDNSNKKKSESDFENDIKKVIYEELLYTGLLYRGI